MGRRERGSHARGVYPTQDTSRIGTVRVKQNVGADIRIIAKIVRNIERRIVDTIRGKVPNKTYLWSFPRDASLPTID